MKKIIITLGIILIPFTAFGASNDITFNTAYTQTLFRGLTRELGIALSYIPLAPAEALKTGHFDVGAEVTVADIQESKNYWKLVTRDTSALSLLPFPKLHVQAGLPFRINIGGIYSAVPSTNISYWGGEAKWAILEGSTATPAVAVRGTYTGLSGVNQLDLHTASIDLSVSKGVLNLTPYAGVGMVWIQSTPKNLPSVLNLSKVTISQPKFFIGTKFSLFLLNMVAEVDVANIPLYSLRLNFGF